MDKALVYKALLTALSEERAGLVRLLESSRDEATHEESRPENQYDTRALEASYLAAGQGERLVSLDKLLGWVRQQVATSRDIVEEGAVVHLESEEGRERWVLIAPEGGTGVEVSGARIDLVSESSPLGKALAGLEEGDGASVRGPNGDLEWEILALL